MSTTAPSYNGLLTLKIRSGICFGHQIIGRALGGECVPNGGNWEIGPTRIETTPAGKKLLGVPELVSPISALSKARDPSSVHN